MRRSYWYLAFICYHATSTYQLVGIKSLTYVVVSSILASSCRRWHVKTGVPRACTRLVQVSGRDYVALLGTASRTGLYRQDPHWTCTAARWDYAGWYNPIAISICWCRSIPSCWCGLMSSALTRYGMGGCVCRAVESEWLWIWTVLHDPKSSVDRRLMVSIDTSASCRWT